LREGLACILYKNLLKCGLAGRWDSASFRRLERLYYQNLKINLQRLHDLKQLLSRFTEAGIHPILLQGVSLLVQRVYDDPGLRMLTDIDLWLPGADQRLVDNTLSRHGYRQYPHYPNLYKRNHTVVDVHYHLLWADRLRACANLLAPDETALLRSVRSIRLDCISGRLLGKFEEVFYLSMHMLKHRADRLIWLLDLDRLTADWHAADWQNWGRQCGQLGQPKLPAYLLILLDQNIHAPLSQAAAPERRVPELRELQKWVVAQRKKKGALPLGAPLVLYSTGPGFKGQLAYALEALFPRPEILRQSFPNLPENAFFRLYLLRIGQIAVRLFRAVIGAA